MLLSGSTLTSAIYNYLYIYSKLQTSKCFILLARNFLSLSFKVHTSGLKLFIRKSFVINPQFQSYQRETAQIYLYYQLNKNQNVMILEYQVLQINNDECLIFYQLQILYNFIMTTIEKINNFLSQVIDSIYSKSKQAYDEWQKQIQCVDMGQTLQSGYKQRTYTEQAVHQQKQEANLQQIQLVESRKVQNNRIHTQSSVKQKSNPKRRRMKQIQEQKRKIVEQLGELDRQIQNIKGKNNNENAYKKREKINKDQTAQKHAQLLVKQLKNQRKQIENRKKLQIQKSLLDMQKQDEQRRKKRQQQALKVKQQRRLAILQRMEQQKKRRQQRKLIEAQSNQLITKLKKQQELQKQMSMAPSQIIQVDHQKKLLQKKNNFDFREIEQHDKKYRQLKQRSKKQKQQRAKSLKIQHQQHTQKFARNVWIQRIQQEQNRKKQQERQLSQRKKLQLQKRIKYGQLVKNIFLPKKKQIDAASSPIQQHKDQDQQIKSQSKTQPKPRTPQEGTTALPKIKQSSSKANNNKFFSGESAQQMKKPKLKIQRKSSFKQFDQNQQQKEKIRKIREAELRKQTKQRLKKLENHNVAKQPLELDEKKKYKNYLSQVKVKKSQSSEWKKIMQDERLTQQQKYHQLMRKAEKLQAKARMKQDKNYLKQTDQDTVNLYIGSIQAKLALLQKF